MEIRPKKHFLNARTNTTLNNDVKGRGIMVTMTNTVSYDGGSFCDFVFDFDQGQNFQKRLFLINNRCFEHVPIIRSSGWTTYLFTISYLVQITCAIAVLIHCQIVRN